MKKDKKRTGKKLPLIIMQDGFIVNRISDLDEKEIKFALNKLFSKITAVSV
jgi:hypothetical protein